MVAGAEATGGEAAETEAARAEAAGAEAAGCEAAGADAGADAAGRALHSADYPRLTNPGLLTVLELLLGPRLVLGPGCWGSGWVSGTGAVLTTTELIVLPPMWRDGSSCLWFEVVSGKRLSPGLSGGGDVSISICARTTVSCDF